MKLRSVSVLAISVVLFLSGALLASAASQPSNEVKLSKKEVKMLIANAQTPEDHLKIASYYRKEARQQEAKAKYHDEMGEMYRQHPLQNDGKLPVRMTDHCKYFTDSARKAAAAANSMAKVHEKIAQELGKNWRAK